MNVSGVKIYEDNYLNELNDTVLSGKSPVIEKVTPERVSFAGSTGHDKIISKNERDFFVNLFPENSEQLQKHTLFNQNGRLQSPNINKGQIVDGRV